MDCTRCEELLSDLAEAALEEPLASEAAEHVALCEECAGLRDALRLVRTTLASEVADPALPFGLVQRVAVRSWASRVVPAIPIVVPQRIWLTAAAVTLVISGAAFGATSVGASTRAPSRIVRRTWNTGVATMEKGRRVVEDLKILRLVVAAAFESRADRVNDRVEDYRQLMEKRRRVQPAASPVTAPASPEPQGSIDHDPDHLKAHAAFYPNNADGTVVKSCETRTTRSL